MKRDNLVIFLHDDMRLIWYWDTWKQWQRAKKVVSDSPGPADFAIGLVIFVLNSPDGQVLYFGEIQITEGL